MNKPVSAPAVIIALLITLAVIGFIMVRKTTPPRRQAVGKKAAAIGLPVRA